MSGCLSGTRVGVRGGDGSIVGSGEEVAVAVGSGVGVVVGSVVGEGVDVFVLGNRVGEWIIIAPGTSGAPGTPVAPGAANSAS